MGYALYFILFSRRPNWTTDCFEAECHSRSVPYCTERRRTHGDWAFIAPRLNYAADGPTLRIFLLTICVTYPVRADTAYLNASNIDGKRMVESGMSLIEKCDPLSSGFRLQSVRGGLQLLKCCDLQVGETPGLLIYRSNQADSESSYNVRNVARCRNHRIHAAELGGRYRRRT